VVCLSTTRLRCAKTAEQIEVLFGIEARGDQENIILDGAPEYPTAKERGNGKISHIIKQTIYVGTLLEIQSGFHQITVTSCL